VPLIAATTFNRVKTTREDVDFGALEVGDRKASARLPSVKEETGEVVLTKKLAHIRVSRGTGQEATG